MGKGLKETQQRYREQHRDEINQKAREWRQHLKIEVLTYYGNNKLACVNCGFSDVRALSIDHVDGRSKDEPVARRDRAIYSRLKREGYPDGFQTLCMNCQYVKRLSNNEL